MEVMTTALEFLPEPAALFEWPALGPAVACNSRVTSRELSQFGLSPTQVIKQVTEPPGAPAVIESSGGIACVSVLHAGQLPRPSLLLVTKRADGSQARALMDHVRIVLACQVNETQQVAARALHNVVQQIGSVMAQQEDMLETINGHMASMMQTGLPRQQVEKLPQGS